MTCILCFEAGGLRNACPCPSTIHVACLAQLLDNKYNKCANCFAEYHALSQLTAAMYAYRKDKTLERVLALCRTATTAGFATESLATLKTIRGELDTRSKIHYEMEVGVAHLSLGRATEAAHHLQHALAHITGQRFGDALGIYVRVLTYLGQASVDNRSFDMAAEVLFDALDLTPQLTGGEAIKVMQAIAAMCSAKGDKVLFADAQKTIVEIAALEEPDVWTKAIYQGQHWIAQAAIGADCRDTLRQALKSLRKRGSEDLVSKAASCLASMTRPAKRLRGKRHPEDV